MKHKLCFPICCMIIINFVYDCFGAGYWDGRDSNDDAQKLFLHQGEYPRNINQIWGPGLIEETIEADVFVAGGGSAGTSAALAAARLGAKTVIVNGRPVLGGNSGSEVKLAMVGACGPRAGKGDANALTMECREGGIVEEYTLDSTVNNPHQTPELFSLELLTLMKAEKNIILFQNTWLVGVQMEKSYPKFKANAIGQRIIAAVCEDQTSQRRYIIKAKVFIDATGDGRLGAEAGAKWIQGREGKDTYKESLAEGPDHETEGTSLDFTSVDYGSPQIFTPPFWARKFTQADFKYRHVSGTRTYGYWWNEVSWPYNVITDNENVTQEALSNILGIWDYIKNSGDHPESLNYGLNWFGNVPCKREGRRFIGQYVSSQNDIMKDPHASKPQEPKLYWDRVAYSGWNFDLHNPKGMRDTSHPAYATHMVPYVFSTPLRSLISNENPNLFFAGRLASFSHVVFGSQRVMKTCATMGQAAGTAAAFSVLHKVDPNKLSSDPDAVWSIQQQLIRDDAYLIGVFNEDSRDHALQANVSASSEWFGKNNLDGKASNVISGQTRAIVAPFGIPPSQGINGTNRWISVGLPASITLTKKKMNLSQIELIFDTGMHRKLTQTVVPGVNMPYSKWQPQPETVRDYKIDGLNSVSGHWETLCDVVDNYQRKRVHSLPCRPTPPTPAPPPPTPAPLPQVQATVCNVSEPRQRWVMAENGRIYNIQGVHNLCLSVDIHNAASGGHGQAVVVERCTNESTIQNMSLQNWQWKAMVGGDFLKQSHAMECINYQDKCQCAHPVTADGYSAPVSVELWKCSQGPHMKWVRLQTDDGAGKSTSGMLISEELCLEVPSPSSYHIHNRHRLKQQQLQRRRWINQQTMISKIQKSFDAVRVTVTATNGINNAHINGIRLYDALGTIPFPHRGKYVHN